MIRAGDAMRPKRAPTAEERAAIAGVLDDAAGWAAGQMPLDEARRLSNGRKRFLATVFTDPADPAFPVLMRYLDALGAMPGEKGAVVRTDRGWFLEADLREHGAMATAHEGRRVVAFPVVNGTGGALYRSRDTWFGGGVEYRTFGVGATAPTPAAWWEDGA